MAFPGMGTPAGRGDGMPSATDPAVRRQELFWRIAIGLTSARVRVRALLELLEEKGILDPGEFDSRAERVWERDYQPLAADLLSPPDPQEAMPEAAPKTRHGDLKGYAGLLQNLISESVGSRVRLRTLLALLEERGILQPGEFETRADAIWDRDYEELTRAFHELQF